MEEQVCVIWAGTNGYLDALPVNKVRAFEDGLLSLLRGKNVDILNTIRDTPRSLGRHRRQAEGAWSRVTPRRLLDAHGRACPAIAPATEIETWMPGTRPGMTKDEASGRIEDRIAGVN